MTMTTYQVNTWATNPFPETFSILVPGNFVDPQRDSKGATDLLGFDTGTNTGAIFASVHAGQLDDGTPVTNGAYRVGDPIIANHQWTHIIPGPFGNSGAQVLFYAADEGLGAFYGVTTAGNLQWIKDNAGWRTTWTHIIAGKFSDNDGEQLLFYDASTGTG